MQTDIAMRMPTNTLPPSFHGAIARSRVLNAGYVDDAARLVDALPAEHQRVLAANCDAVAGNARTLEGLQQALQQLAQHVASFPVDRGAQRSGDAPGVRAMRYCGAVVVHALLAD